MKFCALTLLIVFELKLWLEFSKIWLFEWGPVMPMVAEPPPLSPTKPAGMAELLSIWTLLTPEFSLTALPEPPAPETSVLPATVTLPERAAWFEKFCAFTVLTVVSLTRLELSVRIWLLEWGPVKKIVVLPPPLPKPTQLPPLSLFEINTLFCPEFQLAALPLLTPAPHTAVLPKMPSPPVEADWLLTLPELTRLTMTELNELRLLEKI